MEADISKVSSISIGFNEINIGYVILTIPDNSKFLGNLLSS
jgi:hypothetical protein